MLQTVYQTPYKNAAVITPNDGADLPNDAHAIYVGGAGNINLDTAGGQTVLFTGVAAGTVLDVRAKRIRAASTTATLMIALWN